jgi:hypothetical protein
LNMFESSDSFHLTYFTFGTVESVDENLDVGSSQTWTAQAVCQARVPSGAPVKITLGTQCFQRGVHLLVVLHHLLGVPLTSPAMLPSWGERRRLAPKIKFLHFLHARSELISLRQDEARLGMHLPKHHETG